MIWLSKASQAKKEKDGKDAAVNYGWMFFLVRLSFYRFLLSLIHHREGANYLAFDIIGDLAFGGPFGMIQAGKDSATVPVDQAAVMASYGKEDVKFETRQIPAVQILNGRGEFSMTLGCLPASWRPYARKLPWFQRGSQDVKNLAGIAVMAVAKRLATPTDRVDLLTKLQAGKDDQGRPMGRPELTAEALTLLIAGSDTTSK